MKRSAIEGGNIQDSISFHPGYACFVEFLELRLGLPDEMAIAPRTIATATRSRQTAFRQAQALSAKLAMMLAAKVDALDEKYKLLGRLGEGAFGEVRLARDMVLGNQSNLPQTVCSHRSLCLCLGNF